MFIKIPNPNCLLLKERDSLLLFVENTLEKSYPKLK